jgi:hypothetical protein
MNRIIKIRVWDISKIIEKKENTRLTFSNLNLNENANSATQNRIIIIIITNISDTL